MGAGTLSLQVYMVSTHYLYYWRTWEHMTVPRKIPIHMQEKNTRQDETREDKNLYTPRGYSKQS